MVDKSLIPEPLDLLRTPEPEPIGRTTGKFSVSAGAEAAIREAGQQYNNATQDLMRTSQSINQARGQQQSRVFNVGAAMAERERAEAKAQKEREKAQAEQAESQEALFTDDLIGTSDKLLGNLFRPEFFAQYSSEQQRDVLTQYADNLLSSPAFQGLDPAVAQSVRAEVLSRGNQRIDYEVDQLDFDFFGDAGRAINSMATNIGGIFTNRGLTKAYDFLEAEGVATNAAPLPPPTRAEFAGNFQESRYNKALARRNEINDALAYIQENADQPRERAERVAQNAANQSPAARDATLNNQYILERSEQENLDAGRNPVLATLDAVGTTIYETLNDPLVFASGQAPSLLGAGATFAAGAALTPFTGGGSLAGAGVLATSILANAPQVAASIQSGVTQEVINRSLDELEASPLWAQALQDANGDVEQAKYILAARGANESLPSGVALGLLASVSGVERIAGAAGRAALSRTGATTAAQNAGRVPGLRRLGASSLTEGVEEVGENISQNAAVRGLGLDQDLFEGSAEAFGQGVAGGLLIGGAFSATGAAIQGGVRRLESRANRADPTQTAPRSQPRADVTNVPVGQLDVAATNTEMARKMRNSRTPQQVWERGGLDSEGRVVPVDQSLGWQRMTDPQREAFRQTASEFGVNTNEFIVPIATQQLSAKTAPDEIESSDAPDAQITAEVARIISGMTPTTRVAAIAADVFRAIEGIPLGSPLRAQTAARIVQEANAAQPVSPADQALINQYLPQAFGLTNTLIRRPDEDAEPENQPAPGQPSPVVPEQGANPAANTPADQNGNSGSGQEQSDAQPSGAAQTTAQADQGTQPSPAGATGGNNTGQNEGDAGTPQVPSGSTASTGDTGSAVPAGQPTGQPQPSTTPQTTGERSGGTPASERNTDGGSPAQTANSNSVATPVPRSLRSARANFGAAGGGVSSRLDFESDIEKAAWLVRKGKKKLSVKADEFFAYLQAEAGLDREQAREYGADIHKRVKELKQQQNESERIAVSAADPNDAGPEQAPAESNAEVELDKVFDDMAEATPDDADAAFLLMNDYDMQHGGSSEYTFPEYLADQVFEYEQDPDGVADPLFADALKRLLKFINQAKLAIISVVAAAAIAVSPNPAMANADIQSTVITNPALSSDANLANRIIQSAGDNESAPYIIADKRSGQMYVMGADGQMTQQVSALFGRDSSDADVSGSTPAGRFELTPATTSVSGYGGDVQVMRAQDENTPALAIHRVINVPGENRTGRLQTPTSADNRVSLGCINITAESYNALFSAPFTGNIYVLPETAPIAAGTLGLDATVSSENDSTRAAGSTLLPDENVSAPRQIESSPESTAPRAAQITQNTPPANTAGAITQPYNPETPTEAIPENTFADTAEVSSDGTPLSTIVASIAASLGLLGGGVAVARLRSNQRRNEDDPSGLNTNGTPDLLRDPPPEQTQNEADWINFFDENPDTFAGVAIPPLNFVEREATTDALPEVDDVASTKYVGWITRSLMSSLGKIPMHVLEWAKKNGDTQIGAEFDSFQLVDNIRSITARASGLSNKWNRDYLAPLAAKTRKLARELNLPQSEVEDDLGRYANAVHAITEAHDHATAKIQNNLNEVTTEIDQLTAYIADPVPANKPDNVAGVTDAQLLLDGQPTAADSDLRKGLLERQTELREAARDLAIQLAQPSMDNAVIGVPMGLTRSMAQQIISEVEAKYTFQVAASMQRDLAVAFRNVVDNVAAAGAISTKQLAGFQRIGFENYVPGRIPNPTRADGIEDVESFNTDSTVREIRVLSSRVDAFAKERVGSKTQAASAFTNLSRMIREGARQSSVAPAGRTLQTMFEGFNSAEVAPNDTQLKAMTNKLNGFERSARRPQSDNTAFIRGYRTTQEGGQEPVFYYATDPAMNNELGQIIRIANQRSQSMWADGVLEVMRSGTRFMGSLVTNYTPMWATLSGLIEAFDRVTTLNLRSYVRADNGEQISRVTLNKNLAKRTQDIRPQYGALVKYMAGDGDGDPEYTRMISELEEGGALQIYSNQVIATSTANERSPTESKIADKTITRLKARGVVDAAKYANEKYLLYAVEANQSLSPLMIYAALLDSGVGKQEAIAMVRDQYNPTLYNGRVSNVASAIWPFFRSAVTTTYQVARAWLTHPKEAAILHATLLGFGVAFYSAIGAILGDDEDGVPRLASMDIGRFKGGLVFPMPNAEDGIVSISVGFGAARTAFTSAAAMYKMMHGKMTAQEAAGATLLAFVTNSSPVAVPQEGLLESNLAKAATLMITPMLLQPPARVMLNVDAFGRNIFFANTPANEFDSDQTTQYGNEDYENLVKGMKRWLGVDIRPETAQQLVEGYLIGPPGQIVRKATADSRAEKFAGMRNSEIYDASIISTVLGLTRTYDAKALDEESFAYGYRDKGDSLLRDFRIDAGADVTPAGNTIPGTKLPNQLAQIRQSDMSPDQKKLAAETLELRRKVGKLNTDRGKIIKAGYIDGELTPDAKSKVTLNIRTIEQLNIAYARKANDLDL